MLEIAEIPLFSQLSPSDQQTVARVVRTVDFPAGTALCRKGDPGGYLYAIASGGVKVAFSGNRGVFLGPGHIIGELSLLSGMPASASVIAVKPTRAFALDKEAFLSLRDSSPILERALAELLVDRLRLAPTDLSAEGPSCTVLLLPDETESSYSIARVLFDRIGHYCPDLVYGELREPDALTTARAGGAPEPPPFECPAGSYAPLTGDAKGSGNRYLLNRSAIDANDVLKHWRSIGVTGQHLVLAARPEDAPDFRSALGPNDAVIHLRAGDGDAPLDGISEGGTYGEAEVCEVCLRRGAARPVGAEAGRWTLCLDLPDRKILDPRNVDRRLGKELDMLARWSVHRGVGIAMGAGAARGFAHLGVLKVLEEAEIPMDCFSGTSIGGIVALLYAHAGSADEAIRFSRQWLGGKNKVLDRMKHFRSSLYPGTLIKRAAHQVFKDVRIEDLRRPVSAVAADLMTGEKVVMNGGSAAEAALATSAIPGFFPPVIAGKRVLIDGAPASRVPVDLLERHRCRIKIAVNVAPRPSYEEDNLQQTVDRIFSFFGFSQVWLRSWEVQAYWDGVKETSHADVLLEPPTREFGMFEFDRIDELVEIGVRTASEKLEAIEGVVKMALNPESF